MDMKKPKAERYNVKMSTTWLPTCMICKQRLGKDHDDAWCRQWAWRTNRPMGWWKVVAAVVAGIVIAFIVPEVLALLT